MSLADNKKSILFKFLSIFSVVRIYNILLIVIAQYLTSIFILSEKNFMDVNEYKPQNYIFQKY